jgi:hypothetical protein
MASVTSAGLGRLMVGAVAVAIASGCGGATAGSGRTGSAATGAGGGADGSLGDSGALEKGDSGAVPRDAIPNPILDARTCQPFAANCATDAECCDGYCWNGLCQHTGCLLPTQRGCKYNGDCCAPMSSAGCLGGIVWGGAGRVGGGYCAFSPGGSQGPPLSGSCKVTAEGCDADGECCTGLCTGGYCQPAGCTRLGAACANDSECCPFVERTPKCFEGVCSSTYPAGP